MAKRPVIFISSTFEDLEKHRKELLFSLGSLKQQVEAMEYWGPGSAVTV